MERIEASAIKPKLRRVTLEQKVWFLDYHAEHPPFKHFKLADAFKQKNGGDMLKSSTICDWLKPDAIERVRRLFEKAAASGKIKDVASRVRDGQCPKLESALAMWLFDKETQDGTITDEVLVEKARQLVADFPELEVPDMSAFSRGWIGKFKKCHSIRSISRHGEARSADMPAVQRAREDLAKLLTKFPVRDGDEYVNYALENIFNMDETGLSWRQQPSRTLATGRKAV